MNRLTQSCCPALVLLPLVVVAGCSGSGSAEADDERNRAIEALLEQDAAFAQMASKDGVAEAYQEFLAESAVQLPDGGLPILGKDAIYRNILDSLADDEFILTWVAEDADVSAAGDMGYTWGNYYFEGFDENGDIVRNEGKYVNIWRQEEGDWKVVIDISNQNELPFIEPIIDPLIESTDGPVFDMPDAEEFQ